MSKLYKITHRTTDGKLPSNDPNQYEAFEPQDVDGWDFESLMQEVEDLRPLSICFQYLGFNPIQLREELGISKLRQKVTFVLYFSMTRGTNTTNKEKRTTDKHWKKFKETCKELNLQASGIGQSQSVRTLNRLSAAFPEVCSAIIAKHPEMVKVPIDNLPYWFQFPNGLSMIPKSNVVMIGLWKQWATGFSTLIGSSSTDQNKFWELQEKSTMFTEDGKKRFLMNGWWGGFTPLTNLCTEYKDPTLRTASSVGGPSSAFAISGDVNLNTKLNQLFSGQKGEQLISQLTGMMQSQQDPTDKHILPLNIKHSTLSDEEQDVDLEEKNQNMFGGNKNILDTPHHENLEESTNERNIILVGKKTKCVIPLNEKGVTAFKLKFKDLETCSPKSKFNLQPECFKLSDKLLDEDLLAILVGAFEHGYNVCKQEAANSKDFKFRTYCLTLIKEGEEEIRSFKISGQIVTPVFYKDKFLDVGNQNFHLVELISRYD